jgi:hypothetical protein
MTPATHMNIKYHAIGESMMTKHQGMKLQEPTTWLIVNDCECLQTV